ncbi:MAG TPA: InlB B-repeat-containing protein [Acidimicrobiales bacterium]|jgi:hypothetical protein|nr:InlB B-repeat-containing protein [Acidimicrobiales bacterium]
MASPTPAQLEAKNLVAVTEMNGEPIRSYDSVHKDFPPTTVYVTPVAAPVTKYTVTFHNSGGATINTTSEAAGATFPLPPAPAMPAGQTFESWADGQHTYAPGSTYTMPAADVTFVVEYTVTPVVVVPPPVVTPPPAPGAGPSGLAIPGVLAGFTRVVMDDFTAKGLGPDWCPPYNGTPGGTKGKFNASHTLVLGDSLLRLQMYQDGISDPGDNNWAGAGVNTNVAKHPGFPIGSRVEAAMKWDAHPSVAGMGMFFAAIGWPPEIDWVEAIAVAGGSRFAATAHYGKQNSNPQVTSPVVDLTKWNRWGCLWTAQTIYYLMNGAVWGSLGNPDTNASDPTSLVQDQFVAFQIQDGDPSYPAPDASVTSQNPVELLIDWVVIDVPSS